MSTFKAYRTEEIDGKFINSIQNIDKSVLDNSELVVKVAYTGINYKDYLSSIGNKGITRNYPHTPGIDASGYVVSDKTGTFAQGEEVIVMGYDLGMNTDGGFAEYIGVPAEWAIRKPEGLSLKQAMQIGTSGFTAALGISKMLQAGQDPQNGAVIVSGATGGVGTWAVQILSTLGFEVWAVSGKEEDKQLLIDLGAARILKREEVMIPKEKALVRPTIAGAFDAVGGEMLVSLLKQTEKFGSVATCGNVGGNNIEMTVFPFILNGVNLLGITSANVSKSMRFNVWDLLAKTANTELVAKYGKEISLEEVDSAFDLIKNGKHTGRFTVSIVR